MRGGFVRMGPRLSSMHSDPTCGARRQGFKCGQTLDETLQHVIGPLGWSLWRYCGGHGCEKRLLGHAADPEESRVAMEPKGWCALAAEPSGGSWSLRVQGGQMWPFHGCNRQECEYFIINIGYNKADAAGRLQIDHLSDSRHELGAYANTASRRIEVEVTYYNYPASSEHSSGERNKLPFTSAKGACLTDWCLETPDRSRPIRS